jgi:hypothetical protein
MNPTSSPTPSPAEVDRRVAPRFQPAFGTIYRLEGAGSQDVQVGLVWNLSQTGVSMLLPEPPQKGGVVTGELTNESGGPAISIAVRVVHVRELSTGDFLLGAQFARPLASEEVQSFLTPPPRELVSSGRANDDPAGISFI